MISLDDTDRYRERGGQQLIRGTTESNIPGDSKQRQVASSQEISQAINQSSLTVNSCLYNSDHALKTGPSGYDLLLTAACELEECFEWVTTPDSLSIARSKFKES